MDFFNLDDTQRGGLSSVLGNLFSDPRRPFAQAQRAYDPYMDRASGIYQPFYETGREALNPFKRRLNEMQNPSSFINNLMGNYKESDWARIMKDKSQRAATNAASASGLIGSTPYLEASEQIAGDISAQDMDRWLQKVLGINKDYLSGYDQLIGRGFGAAQGLSDLNQRRAQDEANLAYNKERAGGLRTGGLIGGLLDYFL